MPQAHAHTLVIALAMVVCAAGSALGAAAFLTPDQYEASKLLPPPPADDTAAAKAELEELHQIENKRTPAQLARAKSDDKTEDASIFAQAIGPGFVLKDLPATAKLLSEVRREEERAANDAKRAFKRHRPWIVDAALMSCSRESAPDSSYPSGHATMGYSMGVVLASLAPEKAQPILARAAEYAENRLVCGMHFRRDIEAGQVLGSAVALQLMKNPEFRQEYDAAALELRRKHLTGP